MQSEVRSPAFNSLPQNQLPKKIHFCDLPYSWPIHCKGPKPSPLQTPSLPNKLPTEADSQHGREQTHHDWAQTTVVCCRKGRVCMPVSHFFGTEWKKGSMTSQSIGQKLTCHLPAPSPGCWKSAGGDSMKVRIRMSFTTPLVHGIFLQL